MNVRETYKHGFLHGLVIDYPNAHAVALAAVETAVRMDEQDRQNKASTAFIARFEAFKESLPRLMKVIDGNDYY